MYIPNVDPGGLLAALGGRGDPDETIGVLVADRSRAAVPALIDELNAAGVSFFGGVFPRLIDGAAVHDEGVAVVRLPSAGAPLLVEGLEFDRDRLPLHGACAASSVDGGCTVVVLVDGLSDRIGSFLCSLFHHFGNEVNYLGGGAGSADFERRPCVFTAEGFQTDAAVLAFVPRRGSVGVRHGWEPLMGPLVATRTRQNVIEQLNWEAAFPVYSKVVSDDAGVALDRDTFLDVTKGYPFGIQRAGAECIVRDPMMVDDAGGLVCVGDVPENAVLEICKGRPSALVEAAGAASRDALARSDGRSLRAGLVFDCISRVNFLGETFEEERRALMRPVTDAWPELPLVGALSLGEIASYGEGILEFLNKTVVVGLVHDET